MVRLLQYRCSSVHIILLFFFFSVLILISSMEVAFSDARSLPLMRAAVADQTGTAAAAGKVVVAGDSNIPAEMRNKARALIGSRPPRCERVCMSCGHCEAVQVPIVPQEEAKARASTVTVAAALFTYRVDGITNYKPLSWKCRCGGTILDP